MRGKDVVDSGIYAIFQQTWVQSPKSSRHFASWPARSTPIPKPSEGGNRWRDARIPEQLEGTRQQMLCFYFYVFARSFGGMVARAGQRGQGQISWLCRGQQLGRNKPGSGSTSLKTQRESGKAFLPLLPLAPSLHSSLLSVLTYMTHAFPQFISSIN